MRMRTRSVTKPNMNIDIHRNPCNPGKSRIPVDTCYFEIEDFLKDEIIAAKLCACPACDWRRHMLRALQEIVADYKKIKGIHTKPCCKD